MHKRVSGFLLGCAALALALSPLAFGQSAPPANRPAPRTADGKPDLNGLWGPDRTFIYDIGSTLKQGETLPLQPWAEQLTKKRMSKDDPEANCLPGGVPRMAPYPWKIVQTDKLFIILYEGNVHSYRQVFLDGRPHDKDVVETWWGDSIGHWDGDALVVDTVGMNDRAWLDADGHPHSDEMRLEERYHRADHNTIELSMTLTDPKAYTKPWISEKFTFKLADKKTEMREDVCVPSVEAKYKETIREPAGGAGVVKK